MARNMREIPPKSQREPAAEEKSPGSNFDCQQQLPGLSFWCAYTIDHIPGKIVQEQLARGDYHTAGQVIDEALRLLCRNGSLAQVEEEIRIGLEQANRGEFVDQSIMDIAAEAEQSQSGA